MTKLEATDDLATVRIAVKSDSPLVRLRALKAAEDKVGTWLLESVAAARTEGESWAAISEALGISRQGAWKLYNSLLSAVLEESRTKSGLTEEQASVLVGQELKAVRKTRHNK
jgi:hypothetical protein